MADWLILTITAVVILVIVVIVKFRINPVVALGCTMTLGLFL